ncbi:MAG: glycosyltransferase [Eubacteriales bacterium]|nr:glycosyltransferase [Eubacteriales bacterium]
MLLSINKMYPPEMGGVEVVARELAELGLRYYGRSEVITFNHTKSTVDEMINGVRVMRLESFVLGRSIRLSLAYKKKLLERSAEASMIIYHFPSFTPELFLSHLKHKNPLRICLYHADITGRGLIGRLYNALVVSRFLRRMDMVVATSPNITKSSSALRQMKHVEVIPLGVDPDHFRYLENNMRAQLVEALERRSGDTRIVLFVGRIARYKGIRELIDAMSGLPENYCLVMVSGDNTDDIEEYAASKNMSGRLLIHRKVSYDDLPKYYSAADVLCMPSTDNGEAFGLVAIEAMSCGVPVITTELGTGTSYHNIDGVTGRVIEPKNIRQLSESIVDICENKEKYPSEAIRNRALDFSLDCFYAGWERIFRMADNMADNP